MIKITISPDTLTIEGHAGYAPLGEDIVCAAVSALTLTLIGAIESLTEDEIEYFTESGYTRLHYRNPSEAAKLLIDSFFIGICGIKNEYPGYIEIC